MTPDEQKELRAKSAALAAHGCVTSRRILWLMHDRDEAEYGRQCVDTMIRAHDKEVADLNDRVVFLQALVAALSDKLAVCSDTITTLAERCAGQSELLAKRAETRGE